MGIEPTTYCLRNSCSAPELPRLDYNTKILERDTRIELAPPPWEGGILPLYKSRVICESNYNASAIQELRFRLGDYIVFDTRTSFLTK